jgi:hypothetical protein
MTRMSPNMSNPGTATFMTTAAVARFHHHKGQANATWAIADAKQHHDLLPVQPLRNDAVSYLPPLMLTSMPE